MKYKRPAVTVICIAILLSMSCSLFSSSQVSTQQSDRKSIWIKADQGGTLKLPGGASLEIAPQSLPADGEVSLQVSQSVQATDYFALAGAIYEVSFGTPLLNSPATLTLPYNPTLLPADVAPDMLFSAYYDEATKAWVYAGGDVDTNQQMVTVQTSHASDWSVFYWNWDAWIALLTKTLSGNIVEIIQAVHLLTKGCTQIGQNIQIISNQATVFVQGCIDQDDPSFPRLRVVNPKSFYMEVMPLSGGNAYPPQSMLGPGDSIQFTANTQDPSPLVVAGVITQKAGEYLVADLILRMLPGLNEVDFKNGIINCMTENLKLVAPFMEAVDDLVVKHDGAAAAESLVKFYLDKEAQQILISSATNCGAGVAKTWAGKLGIIASATSMIMSATDEWVNFLLTKGVSQIEFHWNSTAIVSTPTPSKPAPLNRSDPQSVLAWILYGIYERDLNAFEQLTQPGEIQGGIPATEAGGRINQGELLENLRNSLPNGITCNFYSITEEDAGTNISVATSNWQPPFILPIVTNLFTGEISARNVQSNNVLITITNGYISSVGIGAYPEGTDPIEVFRGISANVQPCP